VGGKLEAPGLPAVCGPAWLVGSIALSGRNRVNSKISRFSIWVGVAGSLLTVLAYVAGAFPAVREWRETNLHALSEITCAGATCDTSAFSTDWQWNDPDYVIDTQTRYFIDLATPTGDAYGRFEPLNYSDTNFLARFQEPTSYNTPDGEVWRMYSRSVRVGGERNLQVMVGYPSRRGVGGEGSAGSPS